MHLITYSEKYEDRCALTSLKWTLQTKLCNLVLHQWICGGIDIFPFVHLRLMLKIDPKAMSTNPLYRNVDIFPAKYTQWFRFWALEIKTKQEQNRSLPKAAQLKSLSVACHIWNHAYWLCVVFKCVTVNNCALCGTASDAADWSLSWIGTPVLAPEQNAAAYGTFHLSELFAVLGNKCCVHVSKMPDGRSH